MHDHLKGFLGLAEILPRLVISKRLKPLIFSEITCFFILRGIPGTTGILFYLIYKTKEIAYMIYGTRSYVRASNKPCYEWGNLPVSRWIVVAAATNLTVLYVPSQLGVDPRLFIGQPTQLYFIDNIFLLLYQTCDKIAPCRKGDNITPCHTGGFFPAGMSSTEVRVQTEKRAMCQIMGKKKKKVSDETFLFSIYHVSTLILHFNHSKRLFHTNSKYFAAKKIYGVLLRGLYYFFCNCTYDPRLL